MNELTQAEREAEKEACTAWVMTQKRPWSDCDVWLARAALESARLRAADAAATKAKRVLCRILAQKFPEYWNDDEAKRLYAEWEKADDAYQSARGEA